MPQRLLTALEVPYVITNTTSSGSFVVCGPIDPVRLASAFAALRCEYPVLEGTITATPAGLMVSVPPPGNQGTAADESFILIVQRPFGPGDVKLGLQPEDQVCAVQLVSDGPRHRVTLGVNHALADGAHALFLNLRLWELYSESTAPTGSVVQLPSSPLEFADRFGTATPTEPQNGEPRAVYSAGAMPQLHDLETGEFGFARIQLNQSATDEVRRHAKSVGLSVHGLLAGIITVAERAELDFPAAEPVPMAVFSPVDLRNRATPPLAPAVVTNFAGSSTAAVAVSSHTTAETVGRLVLDRLRSDLADGSVAAELAGTHAPTLATGAPIRLSNIGAIPTPQLPPELEIEDFYTSSEVDIERVRSLARSAPGQTLDALVGMHYHAYTFSGRLSVEMRYAPGTLTQLAVARIAHRIETGLTTSLAVLS